MVGSDPIADMLTRIRNAGQRRHSEVRLPSSKMKEAIARILAEEGYIESYEVARDAVVPELRVVLKYKQQGTRVRLLAIGGLRRVSRPSRRVYVGSDEIPNTRGGLGVCVVSTSQGVMTGREAKRRNLGGEFLCEIW